MCPRSAIDPRPRRKPAGGRHQSFAPLACLTFGAAWALIVAGDAAYAQSPEPAGSPDGGAPVAPLPARAGDAAEAAVAEPPQPAPPPAAAKTATKTATPTTTPPPPAPPSPPARQLEEVVVTGHSLEETLPEQLATYGTRVDVVSAQQIQNSGSTDVAQSLEDLAPGLYLSLKNGPFDYVNVSLQGSRTQDVLWLLDGVRLNNRLYGGTTPLDTFPASIVERLEIIEGPQALFYGTQAVAGAVNIVTKSFSSEPDGAVALGADTIGGRHLDAYFRTGIYKHRFVVYGSSDESTGFQPFRTQDYQPSATARKRAYDVLTLGAKYAYDFRDDLRFSALYQHTDATLDFAMPFAVASAFNQRDEDVMTAKLDYEPSSSVQLFAKGYYHWWRSHYTEFDNVVGMPGTLEVVDDHDFWGYKDYGANGVAKLSSHLLDAFVGYDFQAYSGNDAVLVITEKSEHVNALFAQLRTPDWFKRARLTAGFRHNVPSVGPSALVWNATGQLNIGAGVFARGSVGTAFRLPTAEELFADDPNDERGNPALKPERSFNVNLAVGGDLRFLGLPLLGWEAIGFFRNVSDLISASGFDAATNQSLFENIDGTVRVRGGTFVLEGQLLAALSASASYTYSSAEQTSGLQIDRVPKQQGKAWIDWHPRTLPVGGMVIASYVGEIFRSFGTDDREKLDQHTTFDLAGRVFLDAGRRHTINLRLSNLLNTTYAVALGKGVSDADSSSYTTWNLGLPRTLSARYIYKF